MKTNLVFLILGLIFGFYLFRECQPEPVQIISTDTIRVIHTDTIWIETIKIKEKYKPEYINILDTIYKDTVYICQVIDTIRADSSEVILFDEIKGELISRSWIFSQKQKEIFTTETIHITKTVEANFWTVGIKTGYRAGELDIRPVVGLKRNNLLYQLDYSFLNKYPTFGVSYRIIR